LSTSNKNSMACPEKDANPRKDKKKGGKGCKAPINKQKNSLTLTITKKKWPRSRDTLESTASSDRLRCAHR
jgi:hypothetical protein